MFRSTRFWISLPFVCLLFGLQARPAHAEAYFAGYLGASFTQSSDVEISETMPGFISLGPFLTLQVPPSSLRLKDVAQETSLMGGGKLGYWLEAFPNLGIEADAYHFSPDSERNNVPISGNIAGVPVPARTVSLGADRASILVLGFHLMGRLRFLQSSELPNGRLQPYLGVGPGIFFADVSTFGVAHHDDTVGVQALAGLKVFLSRLVSLFGEYKFSHFSSELLRIATDKGKSTKVTLDLNSHHLYGGVALHFDLF